MKPHFIGTIDETFARTIEGSLSLMPLPDLIQWIELARQSGTLRISNHETTRLFYFQAGKLIFVWSDVEEERFCHVIQQELGTPYHTIQACMQQAEHLNISFLGLLSSNEGITFERLVSIVASLAEQILSTSLAWKTGTFRFVDHLPAVLIGSPVTLHTSQILFDSAWHYDEKKLGQEKHLDSVINEIFELIRKGKISIPPLPTEMQVLMNKISMPDISIDEIVACIIDPLLVSKVLKICNSSFYGTKSTICNIREAIIYMGLKSLTSIITVHALSNFAPRNIEQIQQILQHCLMTGLVAKQLAQEMGTNHEQAFVCGLLHDLGKIIMLELLTDYNLTEKMLEEAIERYHTSVGKVVAQRWNLSEDIQEVILLHHTPEQAQNYIKLVETIHIANLIAKRERVPDNNHMSKNPQPFSHTELPFNDHLDELDKEIAAILGSS